MPLLLLFFALSNSTLAQNLTDYGFTPWNNILVSANGINYRNAWAGGLNNVQFGKIDFNNDGVKI